MQINFADGRYVLEMKRHKDHDGRPMEADGQVKCGDNTLISMNYSRPYQLWFEHWEVILLYRGKIYYYSRLIRVQDGPYLSTRIDVPTENAWVKELKSELKAKLRHHLTKWEKHYE